MSRLAAIRVVLLLLGSNADAAPLSIRAEASKPRTIAGESIVIHLHQRITAPLEMEPVELNRDRTRVRVIPAAGGTAMVFSGQDYLRLHGVPGAEPGELGHSFHAAAGDAFTNDLDLLQYSRPLPAGRYHIEISYRWGQTVAEVVPANPVEVEVAPAKLLSAEYRWFGPPDRRTDLGSIWLAQDGAKVRWLFQIATPKDPGAVLSAAEVAVTAARPPYAPRLAHLNDSVGMHYDRHAVWIEAGRLCWQPVHTGGLATKPACIDHGLADAGAQIADPPLERRAGGLGALVTGMNAAGQAVATALDIAHDGKLMRRTIPLKSRPEQAVVAWSNAVGEPASTLYWLGPAGLHRTNPVTGYDEILGADAGKAALSINQWLGTGSVVAESGEGPSIKVLTIDLQSGRLATATRQRIPAVVDGDESGAPQLVASPAGLFLIGHAATRGFLAVRIGQP
jgi:hypothetical protein